MCIYMYFFFSMQLHATCPTEALWVLFPGLRGAFSAGWMSHYLLSLFFLLRWATFLGGPLLWLEDPELSVLEDLSWVHHHRVGG